METASEAFNFQEPMGGFQVPEKSKYEKFPELKSIKELKVSSKLMRFLKTKTRLSK